MSYHPYGNTDPCEDFKLADKVLNEYWDIAEGLKMKPFLCFGTCLGLVRGDGYIVNDNDIDVGIIGDIERLTKELIRSGFKRKRTYRRNRHFLKYNILLDIWFTFRGQKFFKSFESVTYMGRKYNVPYPVESYLKARYGDWRIKKQRGSDS